MQDDPKDFKSRALPRVPLKLRVNMEFEKFSGFISEYSENISEGGMFIKTTQPKPMGSVFSLEFKLKDDYKLIQGWGEVVWVREKPEGNKAAGMGIRFLDLDEASTDLIRSIVAIHKNEKKDPGIHPFDFMSKPEEEKKIDLSDITKEVFEKSDNKPNVVDDIFSTLDNEITGSEANQPSPEPPREAPLEVHAPQPAVVKASKPPSPEIATKIPEATGETGSLTTEKETVSSEGSFVDEVFGAEISLKEEEAPSTDELPQVRTESVFDKEVFVKVSWYNRPSTLFVILIILVLGFAITVNFSKIQQSTSIIVNFLDEYELIPFVDYEKRLAQEAGKPSPKLKLAVQTMNKTLATPIETMATPMPSPSTLSKPPEVKVAKVTPVAQKKTKKLPVKNRIIESKPSGIKEIKLGKFKNGSMKVSFSLEHPDYTKHAKGEFLPKGPRYLLKIPGINKPYKRHKFTIASAYLKGIRMGLHSNPDQVHIVFDLQKRTRKNLVKMSPTEDGFSIIFGPE